MYECTKSNWNIDVMTKNTCYFRLDRVWNIHVETTENSISSILDFKILWGSTELHLETPRGSRLWRSQYFPLLRNIRISMNKREWSAHSLLVWTPLLKPQLRTCCKSIFCLFVYNVDVSMNTSKSRRPIFSHFDRLYLLYKKILYGEEARCILFVFRSVFSARPKEEILSEHDKPILSASVANQNAVFVLSCPFKFQIVTRQ